MYTELIKEVWPNLIKGIRKKCNLSQPGLSKETGSSRTIIMRWENKKLLPKEKSVKKIFEFLKKKDLNVHEAIKLGYFCPDGFSKDMTLPKSIIPHSEELAELIGILLGDGEIRKDGTIRISFDPKKDKNFLYRRVFPLIKRITNKKIYFESYKRIALYDSAFMRYLKEDCNISPGSKFEHNWEIPFWCFEKKEYLRAALRGLFDTDGYFGYWGGSTEIMYGRFSKHCRFLVTSIEQALNQINIKPYTQICNDGQFRIRIHNKLDVIKFFNSIGTSNLKHIVRFLLWRIDKYEAKIEIEGMKKLVNKCKQYDSEIEKIKIPFYWNLENEKFIDYIKTDMEKQESREIRNIYKWTKITDDLLNIIKNIELARKLNVYERTVRKWRDGTRIPSHPYTKKILRIAQEKKLNLKNYKI